jgi:hypothetical protein
MPIFETSSNKIKIIEKTKKLFKFEKKYLIEL